jgi:hypothetical protein
MLSVFGKESRICRADRPAPAPMAWLTGLLIGLATLPATAHTDDDPPPSEPTQESSKVGRQITFAAGGHLLTNHAVWSPESRWIVYDTRSTPDGSLFDGTTIEQVAIDTGEVRRIFKSTDGAHCGVATYHPNDAMVVFILGPKHPTDSWSYGPSRRQGVLARTDQPDGSIYLDARDLTPPFTGGALRGGTHVHQFDPTGQLVSSTYEDQWLEWAAEKPPAAGAVPHRNLRGIAVTWLGQPVTVSDDHPRNHDAIGFSVLVTQLFDRPEPGSDQISRAVEEGWIGQAGYQRTDGSWQRHALAFQGEVTLEDGRRIYEVFVADLPEDLQLLTVPGDAPLPGTLTDRPAPPAAVAQRRVTFTHNRPHPGLSAPRHWLRSTPDGSHILFLAADEQGQAQLHAVSPEGGDIRQITRDPWGVSSAFSISPDGGHAAYIADGSVMLVELSSGQSQRLTERLPADESPRPEACVISPDGRWIAFMRTIDGWNQIFVVPTGLE